MARSLSAVFEFRAAHPEAGSEEATEAWNDLISKLHIAVGKPAEGLSADELVAEVEALCVAHPEAERAPKRRDQGHDFGPGRAPDSCNLCGLPRSAHAAREADRAPGKVEAVARAIATEFGYEWVFESDTTEENYDAAYWRHVAGKALDAARARSPQSEDHCPDCGGCGWTWDGESYSEDAGGRLTEKCGKCDGSGRSPQSEDAGCGVLREDNDTGVLAEPQDEDHVALPQECDVNQFSSRACERGTKGCEVIHSVSAPPPERDTVALAEVEAFLRGCNPSTGTTGERLADAFLARFGAARAEDQ
jgi:hypothetical protein